MGGTVGQTIRILLADDHQVIRQGLASLLRSEADMEIVGEADDGRKAMQMAGELSPDVVVMDISMPNLNGIEPPRQIAALPGGTRVVALSAHGDQRFVSKMFSVGASGYVLKDGAFDELALALRTVASGKAY